MKSICNKISMYNYALEILKKLPNSYSVMDDSFEGVILEVKEFQNAHIYVDMKTVEILTLNSEKEFEVKHNFNRSEISPIEVINIFTSLM